MANRKRAKASSGKGKPENQPLPPRKLIPRTKNQALLIDAINANLITFVLGGAGTGKTFIAAATAAEHLHNKFVDKIILTRPVVEAGGSLGYLPGSALEKIEPYMHPLFDEIKNSSRRDVSEIEQIEILPLNYMRGRTFKNAFIIADECQNATLEQIKMLLTRFGEGSKMVITGDTVQSDLPKFKQGALESLASKLEGLDLISVIRLGPEDIVRHEIISRILTRLEM
jgi:phosphate starvation-inducible PhoH-like protein